MRVMDDQTESDLAEACSGVSNRACVARSLDNDPSLALVNDLLQCVFLNKCLKVVYVDLIYCLLLVVECVFSLCARFVTRHL